MPLNDRLYNGLSLAIWLCIAAGALVVLYFIARVVFKKNKLKVDDQTFKAASFLEKTVFYFFKPKK